MTRELILNYNIKAMLEFQNLPGKSMLIKYFDYLDIMKFLSLFIDFLINDDASTQNEVHTICKVLALLLFLYSIEYKLGDVLFQALFLPRLLKKLQCI